MDSLAGAACLCGIVCLVLLAGAACLYEKSLASATCVYFGAFLWRDQSMGVEFNVGEPLAYFLTWTTYGTWLPGDERGSWHEGEFKSANQLFREIAASAMKEIKFLASQKDRDEIELTIHRHCEMRAWFLHAVAVRSNHVHVVVTATGYTPEVTRDQFKAWCTRRLKTYHPRRTRFWTEGGSCRYINRETDLHTATQYVSEAQDRKDRDR